MGVQDAVVMAKIFLYGCLVDVRTTLAPYLVVHIRRRRRQGLRTLLCVAIGGRRRGALIGGLKACIHGAIDSSGRDGGGEMSPLATPDASGQTAGFSVGVSFLSVKRGDHQRSDATEAFGDGGRGDRRHIIGGGRMTSGISPELLTIAVETASTKCLEWRWWSVPAYLHGYLILSVVLDVFHVDLVNIFEVARKHGPRTFRHAR
ncbi:hypothetical protein CSOJ01_05103 [Colletotrichum sojae]|uniref:Uncharacterized protein n=1 Tax=Colletotrichum sojae TaxID=2175907 RepID=A0A8H6MXC9_9PEZI|nr:hypothetical protein CSOJ01_05103 [Colletotrichum sojae]